MSNIIKFEIDSKIFYKDLEYIIKGYPSFNPDYAIEKVHS